MSEAKTAPPPSFFVPFLKKMKNMDKDEIIGIVKKYFEIGDTATYVSAFGTTGYNNIGWSGDVAGTNLRGYFSKKNKKTVAPSIKFTMDLSDTELMYPPVCGQTDDKEKEEDGKKKEEKKEVKPGETKLARDATFQWILNPIENKEHRAVIALAYIIDILQDDV